MVKSVVTLPSRMSFHLRDLPKAQRLVADQLDKAGQRFCNLLQRAAGVADQNSRHASCAKAFASAARRRSSHRGAGGRTYCLSGKDTDLAEQGLNRV
jgi:hypothetical protein